MARNPNPSADKAHHDSASQARRSGDGHSHGRASGGESPAWDPIQLVSAQFALANQQLETCTRQMASVMQQIYDAQLLWLGQWDEKSEGTSNPSSAMAQMQEEWLKTARSWLGSSQGR